MLYRNGVERGKIRFGDGAAGKLALFYERLPDVQQRAHPIVSFRLIDCLLSSENSTQAEAQLSRWKMLGETWRWKKRKGDATEETAGPETCNKQKEF
jgi:hypothetical protein